MRPDGLNALSVRHSYTIHVVEVEFRLTRRSVANDVELWNRDTEGLEGVYVERGRRNVVREALTQILTPLTTDVIRDNDVSNPGFHLIREGGRKGIINVNIPGREGYVIVVYFSHFSDIFHTHYSAILFTFHYDLCYLFMSISRLLYGQFLI
jgi:hypothetical protein